MSRRLLAIVGSLLVNVACGGVTGGPSANSSSTTVAPFTLRVAGGAALETNNGQQVKKWADDLSSMSHGKITVNAHYGDLGADVEVLHGLQNGSIDCIFEPTDGYASLDPKLGVFSLPFTFSNYNQVYAAEDGRAGQGLLGGLASKGIVGLAYSDLGFRNFANNVRPINTPADVKGLKLRTLQGDIPVATVKAFGATPVPLGINEIYTSLQTHTVDGLDMPVPYYVSAKLYEVVKYYSLSRHTLTAMAFACSKSKWDTLSPAQQDLIRKATVAAAKEGRAYDKKLEDSGLQVLKSKGVQINDLVSLAAFKLLMPPVYQLASGTIGSDTIQAIQQAAQSAH